MQRQQHRQLPTRRLCCSRVLYGRCAWLTTRIIIVVVVFMFVANLSAPPSSPISPYPSSKLRVLLVYHGCYRPGPIGSMSQRSATFVTINKHDRCPLQAGHCREEMWCLLGEMPSSCERK